MVHTDFFDNFPVLQTKRLVLRHLQPADADAIFSMRTNQRVNQFIARPELPNLIEAQKLVAKTVAAFTDKKAIGWAGTLKSNQQFVGTCGFNKIDLTTTGQNWVANWR